MPHNSFSLGRGIDEEVQTDQILDFTRSAPGNAGWHAHVRGSGLRSERC
jgi:hypothetical protein